MNNTALKMNDSGTPAYIRDWMTREFGFYFERWTITPELASSILENGGLNRKIKPTVVSKYANDMKNHNWYFTPAAIQFDENGKLMDGQHRLSAIKESGEVLDLLVALDVVRGAPIDIHKSRTTLDNLRCAGHLDDTFDNDCTSIINGVLKIKAGGAGYNTYSDFDKGKLLNKYKEELLKTKHISYAGKNHPIMHKQNNMATIFMALLSGYEEDFLYDFVKTVNSGIPAISNPSPPLILARMLDKCSLTRMQTVSVIEQAIVGCASGKSRSTNYDLNRKPLISGNLTLKELFSETEE